jgi:hypothetical protein
MLVTRFGGGLRARPMEARPEPSGRTIYFLTDVRTAKDDEIDAVPEACLVFIDREERVYLSLSGFPEPARAQVRAASGRVLEWAGKFGGGGVRVRASALDGGEAQRGREAQDQRQDAVSGQRAMRRPRR